MNYDRFIELLNLYLDHEISAEDAKALEQEICARPERRKIYEQYCQMQQGTAALFEFSRQTAPSPVLRRAYQEINRKIESRQAEGISWWTWGASGLMAAAACIAVVFMAQPNSTPMGSAPVIAGQTQAPASIQPVATSDAEPSRALAQADLGGAATSLWGEPSLNYHTVEIVATPANQPVKFRPIAKVQNQTVFLNTENTPAAKLPRPLQWQPIEDKSNQTEMTAIQFKR